MDKRSKRYTGPWIMVRNEAAAPAAATDAAPGHVDPASVQIVDGRNNVVAGPGAPDAAPNGAQVAAVANSQVVQASNASVALTGLLNQRLTSFVVGYPQTPLDDLIDFLAPRVAAGVKYSYLNVAAANAFATLQNDGIGQNGLPQVVGFDPDTESTGTLKFRGAETPMHRTERDAANAIPGWSADMELNRRILWLRQLIGRGTAQRVIAQAASSAGAATSTAWTSDVDPIESLVTNIRTVLDVFGGSPEDIRILFGSTAWATLKFHALVHGGTQYPQQAVTRQKVAEMIEVPADNIKVTYHQATTSKQGATHAKDRLLTAADVYIYGCRQNPSLDDPTFLKRFCMQIDGQWMAAYSYNPHPFVENHGLAYYEDVKATFETAVKRLNITT